MTLCIEQESQPTEGATQQEDVSRSYQMMQQQMKQVNDTIATATEHMRLLQETTSQLFIEFRSNYMTSYSGCGIY